MLRAAGADVVACDVTPGAERISMLPTRNAGKSWSRHSTASTGCPTPRRDPSSGLPELQGEDFARVMSIDALGPVYGMQAVLPLMPSGGSIVNICSLAALTGHYTAAYTASKWALRGLSRVASTELARAEFASTRCFPATSRPR